MFESEKDLIRAFPAKRLSSFDGMAVTAQVWEAAHAYHRQRHQYHGLLCHGSGIVAGLKVIASDPPDSSVYVEPGIAIDPLGQIVVLQEHVRYDIAQAHGRLHLLLSYGESRPQPDGDAEGGALYVQTQFGIEAGPSIPESPCVELARIRRRDRASPIADPGDATRPGWNEIDMRFRREIGAAPVETAAIALSYVGQGQDAHHGRGAGHLARMLRRFDLCHAWVDEGVPLGDDLGAYDLVYLVGRATFQPGQDDMQALYTYLQGGGTLLIEGCRRGASAGDAPADAALSELLASLGVQLAALPPDHALLAEPFLFSAPPAGFEMEGAPQVSIGGLAGEPGVIRSMADYGCLWQGERRARSGDRPEPASREEIRAALEWGCNIVAYALDRRRQAG